MFSCLSLHVIKWDKYANTAWNFPFQWINDLWFSAHLTPASGTYMSVKQPRAFQDNNAVEIDMQKQEKISFHGNL